MASRSSGLMAVADTRDLAPRLVKDGLGWRFSPADAPVTIGFSRIVERSSELTAEIHVQTAGTDAPQHVLRRRVNLLGSRTPSDLAKDLDLATDAAGWPWRKIVEQAFASVVEAYREGDEVRLLGGRRVAPPKPVHLIDGLLMADRANTWFGPGGTGKSTAAVAACVASVIEATFAGRPVRKCVPLYLDWEDEDDAFEDILWEVSRGFGLDESVQVHWQRMKSPLAGNVAFLSALIDRIGATLVVIDSATRAMGAAGEHGTYESTAVSFAEAIRALGKVTTLIIDHVDGETVKGGGVAKKAYGSIHKLNFVRNAWSVTLEKDSTVQTVAWTHAKVNRGRLHEAWGMRYERDQVLGGLTLVPMAAADVPVIAKAMPQWRQLSSLLERTGPLDVRAAAMELLGRDDGKACDQVRAIFNRDRGAHMVRLPDGRISARFTPMPVPESAAWRAPGRPDLRMVNTGTEEPDELPF
jgi:hypothetical protein